MADDLLLDMLGGADPPVPRVGDPTAAPGDRELVEFLSLWRGMDRPASPAAVRDDVGRPDLVRADAGAPPPTLGSLDPAAPGTTPPLGRPARGPRFPLLAAAAAVLVVLVGLGSGRLPSDDGGWSEVTRVDDQSALASDLARHDLDAADAASADGDWDRARSALDRARTEIGGVRPDRGSVELTRRHQVLSDQVDRGGGGTSEPRASGVVPPRSPEPSPEPSSEPSPGKPRPSTGRRATADGQRATSPPSTSRERPPASVRPVTSTATRSTTPTARTSPRTATSSTARGEVRGPEPWPVMLAPTLLADPRRDATDPPPRHTASRPTSTAARASGTSAPPPRKDHRHPRRPRPADVDPTAGVPSDR